VIEKGKSYLPKELGLPFPEISRINVGFCTDTQHPTYWTYRAGAHTHVFPLTYPTFGHVCVGQERWLIKNDEPHDLMWHEYGHVLNALNSNWTSVEESQTNSHGEAWQKVMIELGKPHLTGETVDD
jgi:hypothetical protein